MDFTSEICQAYEKDIPHWKIAKMFKVSYATVYKVLKQRSILLTRRVGNELFCPVCEK